MEVKNLSMCLSFPKGFKEKVGGGRILAQRLGGGNDTTFLIVKNKSPFALHWKGKRGAKGEEEDKGRAKGGGGKAIKHGGLSL